MSRRFLFILSFLVFVGVVVWFATGYVDVPDITFAEAAKIEDAKRKVIVTGSLSSQQITADGGVLNFHMTDSKGAVSRVQYTGTEPVSAAELESARSSKDQISVSGHSHGDYFHATGISLH